jgi:hydroxyversicolorone monooxygenase
MIFRAIQKENVDVHFTPVEKITEKGLIGGDDIEREVDTIVCATGFDVSYRPRFPIVGQNGRDLADKWAVCPEGKPQKRPFPARYPASGDVWTEV